MKRCPDARSIPRLLCETLAVKHYADNTWSGILVDFLYYNILFCEEKGLTPEKTSAFFTIMKRVFEFTFRPELEPGNVDDDVERVGVDASFAFFKEQMLRHSVEAPAEGSVGLFTVADVEVPQGRPCRAAQHAASDSARQSIVVSQLAAGGSLATRAPAPRTTAPVPPPVPFTPRRSPGAARRPGAAPPRPGRAPRRLARLGTAGRARAP